MKLCRKSSRQQLDGGEAEPAFGAGDAGFVVLGEAAIATEPGEGSLDHPTAGEKLEALGLVRALEIWTVQVPISRNAVRSFWPA